MYKITIFLVLLFFALSVHADDWDGYISLFGKPDVVMSTEKDNPRPPIVTKFAIYKKEAVRLVFFEGRKGWKYMGSQDNRTKKPLTHNEVERRMARRAK